MDTSAAEPAAVGPAGAAPARINDHAARKRDKTEKMLSGTWDRCMHFMHVKRRYCNSPRASGGLYCGMHVLQQSAPPVGGPVAAATAGDAGAAASAAGGGGGTRIPCPVDPSHTIWEKNWRSHVKRCPSKVQQEQREALPCYSRGYNCGAAPAEELAAIDAVRPAGFDAGGVGGSATFTGLPSSAPPAAAIAGGGGASAAAAAAVAPPSAITAARSAAAAVASGDAGEECDHAGLDAGQATALSAMLLGVRHLREYFARIAHWYEAHAAPRLLPQLPEGDASAVASAYGAGGRPVATMPKRHESQSLALVRLMADAGLLTDPRATLVELGAGSGQLAAVLSGVHPGRRLLLVDRMGGIKKHDSLLKKQIAHEYDQALAHDAAPAAAGTASSLAPPPALALAPARAPRMEFARLRLDIADFCLARHPAARGAAVNDPSCSGTGAGLGGWDHDAERKMRAAGGSPAAAASTAAAALPPDRDAAVADAAVDGDAAAVDGDAAACPPPAKRRRVDDSDALTAGESQAATAAADDMPATPSTAGGAAAAPVVVFGKHVCGGATDLTLRCFFLAAVPHDTLAAFAGDTVGAATHASSAAGGDEALLPASQLGGACIAICCHQRCDWASYTGKRFFRDVLHASPADFEFIRCLSSWAVSFAHVHATAAAAAPTTESDASASAAPGGAPEPAAAVLEALDAVAKEQIGRMCKRLLDVGRLHFVEDVMRHLHASRGAPGAASTAAGAAGASSTHADAACLRHYCSVADSPENCALVVSMAGDR